MSTIRSKLKDLLDALSDINDAPSPSSTLLRGLDDYIKSVKAIKQKQEEEETWRDLYAELVNLDETAAQRKLDQLTDTDFKDFCSVHKIKAVKGKGEKRVKGKIIQKAIPAKKATKKKSAQDAVPALREPDSVIPATTARQATTEVILRQVLRLKSQTTI